MPARQGHASHEVGDVGRPRLLVAVEAGRVTLTAHDHENRAGDLAARLEVPGVHLVIDGGPRAIVLADAMDVLRGAAADVLPEGLLADAALAQPLRAQLEADVVLLLARQQ